MALARQLPLYAILICAASLLCAAAVLSREMQQHVAALQAGLKAAQAAADLEATLREFKGYLDNGAKQCRQ